MVFGISTGSSGEIERIGMKVVEVHRASVALMDWVRLIIRPRLGFRGSEDVSRVWRTYLRNDRILAHQPLQDR